MKALFVCLITLFFSPLLFANQPAIVFKVIGGKSKTISYLRPVEGHHCK